MNWLSVSAERNMQIAISVVPKSSSPAKLPRITGQSGAAKKDITIA